MLFVAASPKPSTTNILFLEPTAAGKVIVLAAPLLLLQITANAVADCNEDAAIVSELPLESTISCDISAVFGWIFGAPG
jgi:hypothetical protein